jgi:hypothetical protein
VGCEVVQHDETHLMKNVLDGGPLLAGESVGVEDILADVKVEGGEVRVCKVVQLLDD